MRPVSLRERAAFEKLLRTRPLGRSAHFAAHYAAAGEDSPVSRLTRARPDDLSTEEKQELSSPVDKLQIRVRLGCVIPKRLARRAVTRNLLRREMIQVLAERRDQLPAGDWLLRQRDVWAKAQWRSAASEPLRLAVRHELAELLDGCAARVAGITPGGSRAGV